MRQPHGEGIKRSPQVTCAGTDGWDKVLRVILKRGNHIVDVANNGLEAVQAISQKQYDIILMDVRMPQLDGLEATRQIRTGSDLGQGIPIIAVTAKAPSEDSEAIDSEEGASGPPTSKAPLDSMQQEVGDRLDSLGILDVPEIALLNLFISDAWGLIAVIEKSIERGDDTACREAAHSLNGACRNLEASRLASLAQTLECAGSDGDLSEAKRMLDGIRTEAGRVEQFLMELLASRVHANRGESLSRL